MRDDEVIDLGEVGILRGCQDAPRIPDRRFRRDIAGVDEQRFTRGRHQERGVATLDVDDIDVEAGACLRGRVIGEQPRQRDAGGKKEALLHDAPPFFGPAAETGSIVASLPLYGSPRPRSEPSKMAGGFFTAHDTQPGEVGKPNM